MPTIERSVAAAAYCCLHGSDQTYQQPAADPLMAGAEGSRRADRGHRSVVLRMGAKSDLAPSFWTCAPQTRGIVLAIDTSP